jgi:hypothetical protein
MKLTFDLNDPKLLAIINHTLKHGECQLAHDTNTGEPSLWLIKDSGAYLMSATRCPLKEPNGKNIIIFAKGCTPEDGYIPGDDFTENIPLKEFTKAIILKASHIQITVTKTKLIIKAIQMKKPSKETKSLPTIYHSLNCSKENENACLVEDIHGGFFIFESPAECHILKEAIHKSWACLSKFMEENKQTILTYHATIFKAEPPKDQLIEVTARYTWNKIFPTATDRRAPIIPTTSSGRKSTIGLCEYHKGLKSDATGLKTPQASTCYKMFIECLDTHECVTETTLRKYVEDNAGRLHTRQDPWRIFQYYRPLLITEQLITRK